MKPETKEKLLYSVCPYCGRRCIKRIRKLSATVYSNRINCLECERKVIVLTFGSWMLACILGVALIILVTTFFPKNEIIIIAAIIVFILFQKLCLWFAPLDSEDIPKK